MTRYQQILIDMIIGCLKADILGILKKSLTDFEPVGSQNWSIFFVKKSKKNDENFFSLFLSVLCFANCIMFPRPGMMFEKQFLLH